MAGRLAARREKPGGAATFLRGRLIEDLIARGIRLVDVPGEPYDSERQWADELRGHIMLTAYSGSVRSRLLEVIERIRHVHDTRVETPSERRDAAATAPHTRSGLLDRQRRVDG